MNDQQQDVFFRGYRDGVSTNTQRNEAAYEEGYQIGYALAFGIGDGVLPPVAQGRAISNRLYVNGHIDSYNTGFNAGLNANPYDGVYERGRGMHDGLAAGQLAKDEEDNAHNVGGNQAQEVAENLEAEENAQVDIEVEQAEEEVPPEDEV